MRALKYVASAFGLMGLVPVLGVLLFNTFGPNGGVAGVLLGIFLVCWAACYWIENA